jgi:RNA polymerase sigma factor (sigma-70 family)
VEDSTLPPRPHGPDGLEEESTATLLDRARSGNEEARNHLAQRYLVLLRRWAHGRLPGRARDLIDTDDLVQETLRRAFDQIASFEPKREGAFLAYLRQILANRIQDEVRRVSRRPEQGGLPDGIADAGPSPLEQAIGAESFRRYEWAMASLSTEEREAVMLRIEMGFTHRELAEALAKPTANAARMFVARALIRLARAMDERRG